MGEAFRPTPLVDAARRHRAADHRSLARRSDKMRRGAASALTKSVVKRNERSAPVGQRPIDDSVCRRDVCGRAFVYRK